MKQRVVPLPVITAFVACLALLSPHTPLLVWNASASAPLGLYMLHPAAVIARGDLVLADASRNFARFAAARGYLPMGVPLVKRIAALSGDTVCSTGARITINGDFVATRLAMDADGRPLPVWQGCQRLQHGDVFLLMRAVPDSFDGRYFGLIKHSAILGTLRPIWTH